MKKLILLIVPLIVCALMAFPAAAKNRTVGRDQQNLAAVTGLTGFVTILIRPRRGHLNCQLRILHYYNRSCFQFPRFCPDRKNF